MRNSIEGGTLVADMTSLEAGEPVIVLDIAGASGRFLPAVFRVDTGTSHTLITEALGCAIAGAGAPAPPSRPLRTPAGFELEYTPCLLHIGFRTDTGPRAYVTITGGVAKVEHNLLGRDFLRHFRFEWFARNVALSIGE